MTKGSAQSNKHKFLYFKILLDILLFAVWAVLMVYPLTGAFWHEWIGLAAIGLIVLHNLLNIRWIVNMSKKIFVSKFTMNTFKYIISFLLLFLMLFSGLSGILIAKKIVFPIYASDFSLWVYLHHLSSYALIILISIHIGIHGKMLLSVCRNVFKVKRDSKTRSLILKILAVSIMVWGVKASLEYEIPLPHDSSVEKDNKTRTFGTKPSLPEEIESSGGTEATKETEISGSTEATEETGQTDPGEDETQPSDDAAAKEAALEEFLSDLYCTACHRHCSLLAPECMSGELQAESATLEFEAQYQSDAGNVDANTETLTLETTYSGRVSSEDSATLLEIAPIMGFWILGAHYVVRLVDYGKSGSSKKKKDN